MDTIEMLTDLIDYYASGNKSQFARMLGVSPQVIIGWSSRGTMNKEQIYRHLPRVSAHWLLTDGEGEMIVPEVKESPPTDDAKHLKKRIVERDRLFPTLSTYYARHSWASIAAELGAPVETISLGLGHRYGPSVTQTYITPSLRLLDECNRMVLDAVTKSAKC